MFEPLNFLCRIAKTNVFNSFNSLNSVNSLKKFGSLFCFSPNLTYLCS